MREKRRVMVLVDGYNLYHGICNIQDEKGESLHHLKWVDIVKLANIFTDPNRQEISEIIYFSAYADHREKAVLRHRAYVAALEAGGVKIVMGQFKKRTRKCKKCGHRYPGHEEKETDVNIAGRMIEASYEDEYDDLFLISGDTDMVGPIKMIKGRFEEKIIKVIVPPFRNNSELKQQAHKFAKIRHQHLENCLLAEIVYRSNGNQISRPAAYTPPIP